MYTESEEKDMREYVETLPVKLHEHMEDFAALKLTRAEVEAFMGTARRAGHDLWTSAIDEEVAERLDVAMEKARPSRGIVSGREHVTTIRCAMSEADKTAMRLEYSGVTDLQFQPGMRGEPVEHARANAARTIASVQLRRMVPRGARVMEVGAKAEHAITFGAEPGTYYGVMPVLDVHDMQRQSQSMHNAKLMLKRTGPRALKANQERVAIEYTQHFDRMFTRKRVQEVVWPADVIMSVDANYDVPMGDMPAVMHRNGAKMWIGSMVRCPDATVYVGKRSGTLRMMGFEYEIDTDRDQITFSFRSSSRPYKHRLSVYREYMVHSNRVFRYEGAQYVYTVLPQTVPSQLMFACYRVPDRVYADSPMSYVPTGNEGMLRIHTAKASIADGGRQTVRPDYFDVSEEHFSRILQDRMLAARKLDIAEVYRIIRMAKVGVVVNGIRVSSDSPLADSLLAPLTVVVNVIAEDMFKKGSRLAQDASTIIRNGGYRHAGIWSTVRDTVWGAVAGPGTFVGVVLDRMQGVLQQDAPVLKVERLATFDRVDNAPVVCLDRKHIHTVRRCACEEIAEATAILEGKRGGLSRDESVLMEKYLRLLRRRGCEQCDFDATRVTKDGEMSMEYESVSGTSSGTSARGSETSEEEEEEFVDAEESITSGESDVDEEVERTEVECDDSGYGQQEVPVADGPVRNSIVEYIDIMERQLVAYDSAAVEWAKILLRPGVEESVLETASDGRLSHFVLKVSSGFIVGILGKGQRATDFARVYDFGVGKFYDVIVAPNRQVMLPRECSSLVYTNSSYLVRNQPHLISACRRILRNPHVGPLLREIPFINGCFGSGKTTEIIREYTAGVLYLTATAASAKTVRARLYAGAGKGRELVRTYDSALRNGVPKASEVVMDEVPMTHAGQVFALLEVVKPVRVKAYGDFFQVPYCSFLAAYQMRYESIRPYCDMQYRMIQHRCRLSVCAAVLNVYGLDSGLGVCGCCEHIQESEEGIAMKKIGSVKDIPLESGVKYISFSQCDKDALESELVTAGVSSTVSTLDEEMEKYVHANTVHETQGGTYDRVALVRLMKHPKPGSIYFWKNYVNVGLTRARLMTTYYTASDEQDFVVSCCIDAKSEVLRNIVRRNSA